MMDNEYKYMVGVVCMTFNQSRYILDALNGFVMQQTNFPFVVMVVDDASTDGEEKVIKKYISEQFNLNDTTIAYEIETDYAHITFAQHKVNSNCYIVAMYLKENHYSLRKKKLPYLAKWRNYAKYEALCEGDDYWIDPLKLQKQIDFLEKNQDYIMCCSDARIITQNKELDWCRYNNNQEIPTKDIIIGGGLFIQTASLLYHRLLIDARDYPQSAKLCHVGDYPLQIFAVLKRKIYWFAEKQVAYRYETNHSWTKNIRSYNIEKLISGWLSEINMLKSMDEYSQYQYTTFFKQRQILYIYDKYITYPEHYSIIDEHFSEIKKMFSFRQKIILFLIKTKIWHFLKFCKSLILSK